MDVEKLAVKRVLDQTAPNPTRLANVLGSFLSQFEFNKVTAILVTRSMQKSARLAEEREIDCCSASN